MRDRGWWVPSPRIKWAREHGGSVLDYEVSLHSDLYPDPLRSGVHDRSGHGSPVDIEVHRRHSPVGSHFLWIP